MSRVPGPSPPPPRQMVWFPVGWFHKLQQQQGNQWKSKESKSKQLSSNLCVKAVHLKSGSTRQTTQNYNACIP